MKETILSIAKWHEQTFPDTDLQGQLAKFQEETEEFAEDECVRLQKELNYTQKALDVAVDVLKYTNKCIKGGLNWETEIDRALNKITALTKGDNNE